MEGGALRDCLAFVPQVLAHLEEQFPRYCSLCRREYQTLLHYTELTTSIGAPQDFDIGRRPSDPEPGLGVICYANCICGSTLSLLCDLPGQALQDLRQVILDEAGHRGISTAEVWAELFRRAEEEAVLRVKADARSAPPAPSTATESIEPDTRLVRAESEPSP
jgi:hypothetical protein